MLFYKLKMQDIHCQWIVIDYLLFGEVYDEESEGVFNSDKSIGLINMMLEIIHKKHHKEYLSNVKKNLELVFEDLLKNEGITFAKSDTEHFNTRYILDGYLGMSLTLDNYEKSMISYVPPFTCENEKEFAYYDYGQIGFYLFVRFLLNDESVSDKYEILDNFFEKTTQHVTYLIEIIRKNDYEAFEILLKHLTGPLSLKKSDDYGNEYDVDFESYIDAAIYHMSEKKMFDMFITNYKKLFGQDIVMLDLNNILLFLVKNNKINFFPNFNKIMQDCVTSRHISAADAKFITDFKKTAVYGGHISIAIDNAIKTDDISAIEYWSHHNLSEENKEKINIYFLCNDHVYEDNFDDIKHVVRQIAKQNYSFTKLKKIHKKIKKHIKFSNFMNLILDSAKPKDTRPKYH